MRTNSGGFQYLRIDQSPRNRCRCSWGFGDYPLHHCRQSLYWADYYSRQDPARSSRHKRDWRIQESILLWSLNMCIVLRLYEAKARRIAWQFSKSLFKPIFPPPPVTKKEVILQLFTTWKFFINLFHIKDSKLWWIIRKLKKAIAEM